MQESAFVDSFYSDISMESAPVSHHPHRMIPPPPETQVEIPGHNQTRSSLSLYRSAAHNLEPGNSSITLVCRGVATIVSWLPRNPPPGAAEKIGQGSPIIEIKQPCPSFHARGCKSSILCLAAASMEVCMASKSCTLVN